VGSYPGGVFIDGVGAGPAAPYMYDGNYVVASKHARPWRKQLNLLMGYLYFYNPIWLAARLLGRRTKVSAKAAGMQIVGMLGVIQTIRRTSGWALRLMFGKIERLSAPPASRIPMHSVAGDVASHATSAAMVSVSIPAREKRGLALPVAG
jgi:hypothetical protein